MYKAAKSDLYISDLRCGSKLRRASYANILGFLYGDLQ